jgi:O-antigen ligase
MFFKALLISIFSDISKIQRIFPFLASIGFQKVMLLIPVIGLALSPQLLQNIKKGFSSPQGKTLLFLSAWIMLSAPFSIYPGGCFAYVTDSLWKDIVLICLILAYGTSRKSIDNMVWAFLLAVSVFSAVAFFTGGAGRFEFIESYDPNENALLFVMCFPFAFWKTIELKGRKKLLMAGLCVLLVIGIILTGSRGGFLGLFAVIAACILQYRRVKHVSLLPFLLIPAVVFGIIYFYGSTEYKERIGSIFDTENNYNYTSSTGRINVWKQGIDMMMNNPLLGVGVQQFESAHGRTYRLEGGKWSAAHNILIQVGAELGFPGLIAYCFIMFIVVMKLRKVASIKLDSNGIFSPNTMTSNSLIGSWIGFMVSGFFLSVAYSNVFFLLFSLSCAFLNFEARPLEGKERENVVKDNNVKPAVVNRRTPRWRRELQR